MEVKITNATIAFLTKKTEDGIKKMQKDQKELLRDGILFRYDKGIYTKEDLEKMHQEGKKKVEERGKSNNG